MSKKVVKDIQIFTNGEWHSLISQKIFKNGEWIELKNFGVKYNDKWMVVLNKNAGN